MTLTADDFAWARRQVSRQARRHPHLREDIEAEAALALHCAALSWDPTRGTSFQGYAYKHVLGGVISFLKRQNRSLRTTNPVHFVSLTDLLSNTLSANDDEPEGLLDQHHAPDRLAKLIATLPRRWAGLVRLHLIDGRSLQEAGAAFGVTMQRAHQMINQALHAMATGERIVVKLRSDRIGYDVGAAHAA